MKIIAIRRDDRFSPNNIENDRLILQMVCDNLSSHFDIEIPIVDEVSFSSNPVDADVYLSMGRLQSALVALSSKEQHGSLVINSPESISRCRRSFLEKLMREKNIAMPPLKSNHGYWLKRGDSVAQSKQDVVFCPDEESLERNKQEFLKRGIKEMIVSSHIVGDLIKFYAVDDKMFRCYYPNDDGISKFGEEQLNGKAHHYKFDHQALQNEAHKIAKLTGVVVYGGDAIVDKDGNFYIIDFNDWPSFQRCREEAADAISDYIITNL